MFYLLLISHGVAHFNFVGVDAALTAYLSDVARFCIAS